MSDGSSDWECLLARPGGTVAGLATAGAANGAQIVFAATSAGVYRSTDRERHCEPMRRTAEALARDGKRIFATSMHSLDNVGSALAHSQPHL